MEIKVGDYVRIRWGNGLQTISKCKNIINMGDTQYAKDDFYIHTDHSGEVIYKTMIIKTSPNIIDLIEVGDILYLEESDDIACIFFKEVYLVKNEDNLLHIIDEIKNKKCKLISIVTKEQFSQMEYKINE